MRELPALPLLGRRAGLSTVAERLQSIECRIARAVEHRRGEDGPRVTLVGASKRQPIDVVEAAVEAGLRCLGENRVQEADDKRPRIDGVVWHLIGPLQSNKARRAVELFDVVETVDRPKIARALDRHAAAAGRRLDCFLQVNVGRESTKSGLDPESLVGAAGGIAALDHLRVVGLMSIPPRETDPEASRPWFRRLRELRDDVFSLPALSAEPGWLSMGMSRDFEVAIEEGATHVRVGEALFGSRPDPSPKPGRVP